jgi:hypothetical protein
LHLCGCGRQFAAAQGFDNRDARGVRQTLKDFSLESPEVLAHH